MHLVIHGPNSSRMQEAETSPGVEQRLQQNTHPMDDAQPRRTFEQRYCYGKILR